MAVIGNLAGGLALGGMVGAGLGTLASLPDGPEPRRDDGMTPANWSLMAKGGAVLTVGGGVLFGMPSQEDALEAVFEGGRGGPSFGAGVFGAALGAGLAIGAVTAYGMSD
ncbi:MAG: hypothetical protein JWM98_2544 [Thermoleophilia bacterium]|nr:hypothetical protein [Thermoleophilia bacterium]